MQNSKRKPFVQVITVAASLIFMVQVGSAMTKADLDSVPTLSAVQLLNENPELRRVLTQVPANPQQFAGKRIALLTTDGVEEIELVANRDYFKKRGASVDIVAPRRPELPAKFGVQYPPRRNTHVLTVRFMENADWVKIDRFLGEVKAQDYDAIIIAGGTWNPDALRIEPEALTLVKDMNKQGKTIAAICHGPLVLVNAGILNGRAATATWNVQQDLRNAGALVSDVPVVIDGGIITSRHPIDLPTFLTAIAGSLGAK